MFRRPSGRSGMALILALATIVLAGGLILLMQARASGAVRLEQMELIRERLRIAAAEAVREAMWQLAADENLEADHLGEDWAQPLETLDEDGISTLALIEDAGRFFHWNNVAVSNSATRTPRDILHELMIFCGDLQPAEKVAALVDFMDADDEGTYEADFYRRQDPPWRPPNRQLWAPEELTRVHGFSREMLAPRPRERTAGLHDGDLARATVLAPVELEAPVPINVNTAGRDVLMGLAGLEQERAVDYVLSRRRLEPFESLDIFGASPELAAALQGLVSTHSEYFRIRARASLGNQSRSALVWVQRDSAGDVHVVQWVEAEG